MGSSESKQRNSISVPRKSQIQVNQLPYYTDNNPNDASQRVVYNYHTGPQLEMPFQSTFQCSQCGIVFPTDEALYKHRLRFCVGNPEAGIRKHPTYLTNGLNHDPRRDNFLNNQTSSAKFNVYASPVDRVMYYLYRCTDYRMIVLLKTNHLTLLGILEKLLHMSFVYKSRNLRKRTKFLTSIMSLMIVDK